MLLKKCKKSIVGIYRRFSVPILLSTLFAPWKRIVSYPGESLNDKMKAMIDNLVSRFVGFSVRIIVIFAAVGSIVGIFVFGLVAFIVWPALPVLAVVLAIGAL